MSLGDDIRDDINKRVRADIDQNMRDHPYPKNCQRGLFPPGTLSGLILIAVGTLFLLDHLHIIHIGDLWRFWPLLVILLGISRLTNEGNITGGVILIVVGGYFMLRNMGVILISWESLWPGLLILAGILMIVHRFGPPGRTYLPGGSAPTGTGSGGGAATTQTGTGQEVLNEFALFGGVEKRITTQNFRGGRLEALFGGIEIDLRGADIDGNEAIIEVQAMFGGVEISVPDRWMVVFQGQSIFGGFSDDTRPAMPDVMASAQRKVLVLRGRAIFGGIEVKN